VDFLATTYENQQMKIFPRKKQEANEFLRLVRGLCGKRRILEDPVLQMRMLKGHLGSRNQQGSALGEESGNQIPNICKINKLFAILSVLMIKEVFD
jgi:hypothetical protein